MHSPLPDTALQQRGRNHRGFTLVELLVVIALIGLLAGLTMTRMGSVTHRARLQAEVERLAALDGALRSHAARHAAACRLKLDLDAGEIERVSGGEDRIARTLALSGAVRLSRFLSATRDTGHGTIHVDYSPQGTSESFALQLQVGDGESRWLLFAGVTGQITEWEEQRDVERILHTLHSTRVDLD